MSRGARILLVEDEGALARAVARRLQRDGHVVVTAGSLAAARDAVDKQVPDLLLLDLNLPDGLGLDLLAWMQDERGIQAPALVMTAYGELDDAIVALRRRAVDFLRKPVDLDHLCRAVGEAVRGEAPRRPGAPDRASGATVLIGESPAMQQIRHELARVAPLGRGDAPPNVLITGETGTGKDLAARALHEASPRAAEPFVQVDCTALPGELIESELFGHEKGAFTDAHRARDGLLAAAGEGTAFLNEVGELPLSLQAKLLTALESRTIREVGSSRSRPIAAWFVAATNRELDELVAEGGFRSDLYYRLHVLSLRMPPLRERGEDVIELARHFVADTAGRYGLAAPEITAGAEAALRGYHWPGNVRELRHVIERAVLIRADQRLEAEHLQLTPDVAEPGPAADATDNPTLAGQERALIEATLAQTDGNISETARRLGLSRGSLRYRLDKYGL
ncbi:sigma-54 dependent transcriptional regulator [Spectribacter hydrogenoxidans]|uniref:Sigma-54 dependent transcriptional regulator n=1 Tax=Spectribacter hydrogenoxidans TaxID=3075608 RepID=A0ABU3C039_9GAMM|nr:sigma-54 dependent transcriptional regulator [Salinisphaera sp. W335]MDT0634927.1 sigma-54 dependent transcriptional regulator [Salinisphaera sp. W335]